MPSISPSLSDEMPFDEDSMSQSPRSHIETGRRELSIGVPVRTENCFRQPRHRYRPGRLAKREIETDPQR